MSIFSVGLKALRKIQLGRESTVGTAVAATTIWRGPGVGLEDQLELTFAQEDVGYLSGTDRTYIAKLLAAIAFDETEATFEQLPHILEAGVRTDTPAQDGTGSGYIYEYIFPTTAQNTIKTYTIEAGDNQQAEEMAHAFVSEFKLAGKAGEALKMSATWLGRQATNTTFTGALTPVTVEEILASKGALYIDAVGGTIGSTQVTNTLLDTELTVKTGWVPVFTHDGELYFSGIKNTGPEVLLKLTYEHNSSAVTEKTAWRNQTPRQMRLLYTGGALGTPGTAHSNKKLIIDIAGKYEKFDVLGEQNGNDVLTCTLRGRYNATADLFCETTVVNELTALPYKAS
jgi:hypothetical protein